ncbi:MAG TPA: MFS transporter [Actinomycetales bacterium]|nr:MFS transporter [Actinomycetales bacterium]
MTRWQVLKAAFLGYGRLPALTGRLFLPVGFIARLPFSMAPMGILVLVTYATGSYSQAGLAAGAAAIGTALSAALVGGLADRLGQRPVLLVLAPLNGASLLAIVWAVAAGHRGAAVLVLCFISGFTQPQVGPLARVRWLNLTQPGSRDINIAMSYESTADELSFVFGPALIGIIAGIRPELGLVTAGALSFLFVAWFALHPSAVATRELIKDGELNTPAAPSPTAAVKSRAKRKHSRGYEPNPLRRRLAPAIVTPALGMAAMGTFFGGNQASITATADRWGAASAAGLLYALMGFTAAIVALGLVVLPERITQVTRWRAAAFGLMCVTPLLMLPRTAVTMVPILLIVGLFVGPTMVTIFSVAGERAPAGREGMVMTMLSGATVVGNAIGSSIAGRIAESQGPNWSFGVSALAAVGLFLAAMASGWHGRSARAEAASGSKN